MITCSYESGDETSLRHVTVDVFVICGHKVLLGKRGSYHGKPILESGKWADLGGFMDRDENLEAAAKREVLEEAGVSIDKLQLIQINDNPLRPAEDRQNVTFVFMAEAQDTNLKLSEETRELKWFDLDEVPPEHEWAFDHYASFQLCKKYLQKPFNVPVLG